MTVRITDARKAMAERDIDEATVLRIADWPEAIMPADRPGRQIRQGLAVVGDPPFKALLRVVVDLGTSPPSVVTVYATTQFRRYGASP